MNTSATSLAAALRKMGELRDVIQDTHGNASVRLSKNRFLIKPSGVPYGQISEQSLCEVVMDQQGSILSVGSGKGLKPSVDTQHHAAIYARHPWIGAICHTHSPYSVAFAIVGSGIECACTEHADYFGGEIRCTPYRDLDSWGRSLVLKPDERAVLLGGHGVLTFASDPHRAVDLAAQVENAARKVFLARQLQSTMATSLPEAEVAKWHHRYTHGYGQGTVIPFPMTADNA
jgi:L-ribulose-5-phosphate 4-epimerase